MLKRETQMMRLCFGTFHPLGVGAGTVVREACMQRGALTWLEQPTDDGRSAEYPDILPVSGVSGLTASR
jgi:hypothetical protein